MRKSLWMILALLLGAGAGTAHANTSTLDVSATLVPYPGSACTGSGCTLSGTLVLDNTAGTFLSSNISLSGGSPAVGPFTKLHLVARGELTIFW